MSIANIPVICYVTTMKSQLQEPRLVKNDPLLKPYEEIILRRIEKAGLREKELLFELESLKEFATGHLYFGLHRRKNGWIVRDWAPHADAIYLIGEFSRWQDQEQFAFQKLGRGIWQLEIDGEHLRHADLYKLRIHWPGGVGERIPSWATRVVQDPGTHIFSAQVWDPASVYQWRQGDFIPSTDPPLIYEAHVGMATEEYGVGTYEEFRRNILPRIAKAGYNTLQLMAIQEHPYYGSFGYHVSNFFAASSRFGTPEELKALIDDAHQAGLAVIMDLVHSHAVKNEAEGLARYDGTRYQFFHAGPRGEHRAWNSLCFNYAKHEVIHFLLSNCAYWLGEYRFDGFRFDGVTSMLYLDHGLERSFTSYGEYYDGNEDEDAIVYLRLANKLIHELRPHAITIAEDMSGMPGLAMPGDSGGFGFDYRLAMGIPDYWIRLIKERPDETWSMGEMYYELTNRRADEKTIGYTESHDQALVGDQTIVFRLMGKEMYFSMEKGATNLVVERGMALHKMIRLITIATAGSGYLNFMGNEFGHPEWIDFPREGNNWSYQYARRQWGLMDDQALRYHFLADFDRDMIKLVREEHCFDEPYPYRRVAHEEDQVLAFTRRNLLFVFNFHPSRSYTDYCVPLTQGEYEIVLTTDDSRYGGYHRIDQSMTYESRKDGNSSMNAAFLRLYLPSRTASVWKKKRNADVGK